MYKLLLVHFMLMLVEDSQGDANLHKRRMVYGDQQYRDFVSKDKLNLNELRLLEKYDDVMAAIKRDKDERQTGKRDLLRMRLSTKDEGNFEKRRENIDFGKINDLSENINGDLNEKLLEQRPDWSLEDSSEISHADGKGSDAESNIDTGENNYDRISNRHQKDRSTLHINNMKLNLDGVSELDDYERDSVKDVKRTKVNNNGRLYKKRERWAAEDDGEHDIILYDNQDIEDWSNKADNIIRSDSEMNDHSNAGNSILTNIENEKKDESEAEDEGKGDREEQQWIKRNGKEIVESIEKSLGLNSGEVNKKNSRRIAPDDIEYTRNAHRLKLNTNKQKKESKKPKKQMAHTKSKGAIYRPWIKQNNKKGKRRNDKGDSRFINHLEAYWVSNDGGTRGNNKNVKREKPRTVTVISAVDGDDKRDDKRNDRNTNDINRVNKHYDILDNVDRSWRAEYDNIAREDVNHKLSANAAKRQNEIEKRKALLEDDKSNVEDWRSKEDEYSFDGSSIKNLLVNDEASKTLSQKEDSGKRNTGMSRDRQEDTNLSFIRSLKKKNVKRNV